MTNWRSLYSQNTCSWNKKETTNSLIQSTAKISASLLKPLCNDILFLIHYFKKHFRPCFFILKALKDLLKHFKFVNWRIILSYYSPNFLCIIWSKSRFHWFFILGSNIENFYNFVTVCILCTSKLFFHIFKGKQNTKLDFFCFVRSAHFFFLL